MDVSLEVGEGGSPPPSHMIRRSVFSHSYSPGGEEWGKEWREIHSQRKPWNLESDEL